jgi:tetratricopeptide (TPR) repeat protein
MIARVILGSLIGVSSTEVAGGQEASTGSLRQSPGMTRSNFDGELLEAKAYAERGRYEKAIECLQQVLKRDPANREAHAVLLAVLIKTERYDVALSEVEYLTQFPNVAGGAYALRGLCLAVAADFDDDAALDRALSDVEPVPSNESLKPYTHLARGIIAAKKGKYDQATTELSSAIERLPDDTVAHCFRGFALMMKGEFDRAIADFDHAIQKRVNFVHPKFVLCRGECFALVGKFENAIADFTTAIKRDPKQPANYEFRADAYQAEGRFELALADLDEATRLQPNDLDSYLNRSALLIEMKKKDRAIQDASRIVELCPKDHLAYGYRALTVCLTSEDWTRALADLDHSVKLEQRDFFSYGFRAFLEVQTKKYVRALADITMCGLTLNQSEFRPVFRINTYTNRFSVGISWHLKDIPAKTESRMLASQAERQSIERGVDRLMTASLQR